MDLLRLWDLVGVFVFALSGAVAASHRRMDVFGGFVLALITATGGGTIRSVFLDDLPPPFLRTPWEVGLAVVAVLVVFMARANLPGNAMVWADAVGLGVFTAVGSLAGLSAGLAWWAAIGIGVVTAVFGGMLRDLLCGQVPIVMTHDIYATACIAGGLAFVGARQIGAGDLSATFLCFLVILALRVISTRMNLQLPNMNRTTDGAP